MIDNYDEAIELMRKLQAYLPILVRPSKETVKNIREQGLKITSNQIIEINSLLYMGDEGGIGCGIKLPGNEETAIILSLTHLRVIPGQPLTEEIRAYQIERTKRLAEVNRFSKTFKLTLKPSKKRKRKKR